MSFFRSLFDLSFSSYVTVRIARWAYVATIVFAALLFLTGVVAGFNQVIESDHWVAEGSSAYSLRKASEQRLVGYAVIALSPVAALLIVVFGRIAAEMTIVVFSIAESLRRWR